MKTGRTFNISHYIVSKKTKWEAAPSHSGCFLPGDSVTVLICLITSALLTGELEQLICVSGKSGKSNVYAQPSDFPFGMFGKAACKDPACKSYPGRLQHMGAYSSPAFPGTELSSLPDSGAVS